jgi:putative oxidoreductase
MQLCVNPKMRQANSTLSVAAPRPVQLDPGATEGGMRGLLQCVTSRAEAAMRIFDLLRPLALLWLRVALAVIFFHSGYEKLFGAPASALTEFRHMGFPPYFAYAAGTLELFGAILLVLGLLTRWTAFLLAIEMGIALAKIGIPQGSIYAVQNYELPLALCAAAFTLVGTGAGLLSVDAATFERTSSKPRKPSKS